jgi:hypothetical protein
VACHNSVGFGKIPIVVLNCDGFYDGILAQIQRAADDKMLYTSPDDTLHVEATVAGALEWCAQKVEALAKEGRGTGSDAVVLQSRTTTFIFRRRHSFMLGVALGALAAVLTVGEAALATRLWKRAKARAAGGQR